MAIIPNLIGSEGRMAKRTHGTLLHCQLNILFEFQLIPSFCLGTTKKLLESV